MALMMILIACCRYLGLQVGYKTLGIALLAFIGWKTHRSREYVLQKKPEGPLWCLNLLDLTFENVLSELSLSISLISNPFYQHLAGDPRNSVWKFLRLQTEYLLEYLFTSAYQPNWTHSGTFHLHWY